MSWNYRIIRYANGDLGLHEVHYDADGKPESYTERPAAFVAFADEGPEDIAAALKTATSAASAPVLDVSAFEPDN